MEDGDVFPKLLPVGMANTTKTSATFAGIFDRNHELHLVGSCQQWGRQAPQTSVAQASTLAFERCFHRGVTIAW